MPRGVKGPDTDRIAANLTGDVVRAAPARTDFENDHLYGGLAGFELPVDAFEIAPGLMLRKTYAYVIAPHVVAFAPPPKPRAVHPGPWAPLNGDGITIAVELHLAAGAKPTGFDRLNTLWFALALLRLRLGVPIQMPLVAGLPLTKELAAAGAPPMFPVELQTRWLDHGAKEIVLDGLGWIRDNFDAASKLANDTNFNRALQSFDAALAITNPGAAIVMCWATLESLVRPGSTQITARLCRGLATLLYPPGPARDRAFTDIRRSYVARCGAAHEAALPEKAQSDFAFSLARSAMLRTIEARELPDIAALMGRWARGT